MINKSYALILLDHGSRRAASVFILRRLATDLADLIGERVYPVSLDWVSEISCDQLAGLPAETLQVAVQRFIVEKVRHFLILPVFFSHSHALNFGVPRVFVNFALAHPEIELSFKFARPLCPLPMGEMQLVEILSSQISETALQAGIEPQRVLLVDHGSPRLEATEVRRWLALKLSEHFGSKIKITQASLEQRDSWSVSGENQSEKKLLLSNNLLAERLQQMAEQDEQTPIIIAGLFLTAGQHAGPDGDLTQISNKITEMYSKLKIYRTPLISDHPGLLKILSSRRSELIK